MIVSHSAYQVLDIGVRLVAHHRKEGEFLAGHVGDQLVLKVDKRLRKAHRRAAMGGVNVFHFLRKRDQPFEVVSVCLVISLQNMSDKLVGAVRRIAPCGLLECPKAVKQVARHNSGIGRRITKRDIAIAAKTDSMLSEEFGCTRKFACNRPTVASKFKFNSVNVLSSMPGRLCQERRCGSSAIVLCRNASSLWRGRKRCRILLRSATEGLQTIDRGCCKGLRALPQTIVALTLGQVEITLKQELAEHHRRNRAPLRQWR